MSIERMERIRLKEKEYHDDCYENMPLFQSGSWLHKPVKTVLDTFELLDPKEDLRILDAGCGVGRNSIPLAQRMRGSSGKVVCVDLLESAIRNLENYGAAYGVADHLEPVVSDVKHFRVAPRSYDYVFAVSALEHLDSKDTFNHVLADMMTGTKERGIHCFIINSNVRERSADTGDLLDPMFEIVFDTEELLGILTSLYNGWRILKTTVKPYEIEISRDGRQVRLESDVVTWVAKKDPVDINDR